MKKTSSEGELAKLRALKDRLAASNKGIAYSYIDAHVLFLENGITIRNLHLKNVDLRDLDLSGMRFESVFMDKVDISGADLAGSIFVYSKLNNVIAKESQFSYSMFSRCDMDTGIFDGSVFDNSTFIYSNVKRSQFYNSCMESIQMFYTGFHKCTFAWVSFRGTSFANSTIIYSQFEDCDFTDVDRQQACPETGSFIGWKKCNFSPDSKYDLDSSRISPLVVKLLIPNDAKRCSGVNKKCRASKAVVLDIQYADGTPTNMREACSVYDPTFRYRIGETVLPTGSFDPNRWNECSEGIHFFMHRKDAVDYRS